jgi:hypothetical protein
MNFGKILHPFSFLILLFLFFYLRVAPSFAENSQNLSPESLSATSGTSATSRSPSATTTASSTGEKIPLVLQLLKARLSQGIYKPTKLEFEISFENFPEYKIKETWWVQNSQTLKIQTQLIDQDWLYWEILFLSGNKKGPHPDSIQRVSWASLLSEQIYFLNTLPTLTQALNQNKIQFLQSKLSRQQGRVALKLPSTEPSNETALWIDQSSGELLRLLLPTGCNITYFYSATGTATGTSSVHNSFYPKLKKAQWIHHKAELQTLTKADILKYDPSFFQSHSTRFKENPLSSKDQEFLDHLKSFYQYCR